MGKAGETPTEPDPPIQTEDRPVLSRLEPLEIHSSQDYSLSIAVSKHWR